MDVWDGTELEFDRGWGRWSWRDPEPQNICACGASTVGHGRCEACHAEAKKERDAMVQRFREKREREGRMNR